MISQDLISILNNTQHMSLQVVQHYQQLLHLAATSNPVLMGPAFLSWAMNH